MWLSRQPTAGLHSSQSSGLLWNWEGLMASASVCAGIRVSVQVFTCMVGLWKSNWNAWSPRTHIHIHTHVHVPDALMINALRIQPRRTQRNRNCICTQASGPKTRRRADYPFYVYARCSHPPGPFFTWPIFVALRYVASLRFCNKTCAAAVSLQSALVMCGFFFFRANEIEAVMTDLERANEVKWHPSWICSSIVCKCERQ